MNGGRARSIEDRLDAARGIEDPERRSRALAAICEAIAAIAPHLPEKEWGEVLRWALWGARRIDVKESYSRVLAAICEAIAAVAPRLPERERSAVLMEALWGARRIDVKESRSRALAAVCEAIAEVASHLPEREWGEVLRWALWEAREIEDEESRSRVLAAICEAIAEVASHFREREWGEVLRWALWRARSIDVKESRSRAIAAICEAIAAVAPYLPEGERGAVLGQALQEAREIEDPERRSRVLAAIREASAEALAVTGSYPSHTKLDLRESRWLKREKQIPPAQLQIPSLDLFHFTVTSPPLVEPGSCFKIYLWAHLSEMSEDLLRKARDIHREDILHNGVGPRRVARGSILSARLELQDLIVNEPEAVLVWEGELGNANFLVEVPQDVRLGKKKGTIKVCMAGMESVAIQFVVEVGSRAASTSDGPTEITVRRHRKAFASYADDDYEKVALGIVCLEMGNPELRVWLDKQNLRPGQRWREELEKVVPAQDIFYLFWSEAASVSPYVEWEWRCALDCRGIDYIAPIPLDPPEVVPPPEELADELHFNDWRLAYARFRDISNRLTSRGTGSIRAQ